MSISTPTNCRAEARGGRLPAAARRRRGGNSGDGDHGRHRRDVPAAGEYLPRSRSGRGDRRHDLGHPHRRAVSQRGSRATSAPIRPTVPGRPTSTTMKRLLDAAGGLTRIVTLAPERDAGNRVTRFLAEQGVRVSAGHCNPSLDELRASIDAGLSLFTHLGNGCPGHAAAARQHHSARAESVGRLVHRFHRRRRARAVRGAWRTISNAAASIGRSS